MKTVFVICNMIVPFAMIVMGMIYQTKIMALKDSYMGYRSVRSMKNEDTWQFAHIKIGRLWFGWGIIMLAVTAVLQFFLRTETVQTVCVATVAICFFQVLLMILPLRMVEKALKFTFDKDGNRYSDSDAREI